MQKATIILQAGYMRPITLTLADASRRLAGRRRVRATSGNAVIFAGSYGAQ